MYVLLLVYKCLEEVIIKKIYLSTQVYGVDKQGKLDLSNKYNKMRQNKLLVSPSSYCHTYWEVMHEMKTV